jgi:hypothetical protein
MIAVRIIIRNSNSSKIFKLRTGKIEISRFSSEIRGEFNIIHIPNHCSQYNNCSNSLQHFNNDSFQLFTLFSLGSGERQTGSDDTFDSRIVGQVHEEDDVLHTLKGKRNRMTRDSRELLRNALPKCLSKN